MNSRKFVFAMLGVLAITGVPALAFWVSGISITGSFESSGGSVPSTLDCVRDVGNLTAGGNSSVLSCVWANDDGAQTMEFTADESSILTGDTLCTLMSEDYLFYCETSPGADYYEPCQGLQVLYGSGDNTIRFKVWSHLNACPVANGSSFSLVGNLV